jgi:hypothetical protein
MDSFRTEEVGMSPGWQPTALAGGSEPGAVCIANISAHERRKRLVASVIQVAIGLAILAALIVTGADRWWRLPLLLVFWGSAVGFFQWRDKT